MTAAARFQCGSPVRPQVKRAGVVRVPFRAALKGHYPGRQGWDI